MRTRIFYILTLFLFLTINIQSQDFWEPAAALSSGNDNVMAEECIGSNIVLAYSNNVGLFRSTNIGTSWNQIPIATGRIWHLKRTTNNIVYALSSTNSAIYIRRSLDSGLTWNEVYSAVHNNNYASGGGIVFINDSIFTAALNFTIGPTIGHIASEIVRTTNGGANWQLISVNTWGFCNDLEKLHDGRILATTSLGGMFYSTNNGNNWNQVLTYPPSYTNKLAITVGGDIFMTRNTAASTTDLVFRSTDNGQSWQGVGLLSGANGGNSEAIYIDPIGRIYVAITRNGPASYYMYRSTNNGYNWTDITAGIPSKSVNNLTGNSQNMIFAGTTNGGVYRSTGVLTNFESNLSEIPKQIFLGQNYPNPFNPVTAINIQLSNHSKVILKIYDAVGNEIETLVNEELQPGKYSITWDGSWYPSGVYFYKLISVNNTQYFTETRKMILLK